MATITPNDKANFSPTDGKYSGVKPFKAWVQMVLPQVYNDALSYQELVYKMLYYLNTLIADVDTVEGNVTNLHTAYDELEAYMNEYIDTLDVQEEINNKLDDMANDGSLSTLIEPFIPSLVSTWLNNNITQETGYVLDDSLSISGAAADAATVGEKALLYRGSISNYSDYDDLTEIGYYFQATGNSIDFSTISNMPTSTTGYLIVFNYLNTTLYQLFITGTTLEKYERRCYGSVWSDWSLISTDSTLSISGAAADAATVGSLALLNRNTLANGTDLDDVTTSGYYLLYSTYSYENDISVTRNYFHRILVVFATTSSIVQTILGSTTYTRSYQNNGWCDWHSTNKPLASSTFDNTNSGIFIYYSSLADSDAPIALSGIINNVCYDSYVYQTFYPANRNTVYHRWYASGWQEWYRDNGEQYTLDNSTDIDDLTKYGTYYLSSNYTGKTLPNYTFLGGILLVFPVNTYTVQILLSSGQSFHRLYISSWSKWHTSLSSSGDFLLSDNQTGVFTNYDDDDAPIYGSGLVANIGCNDFSYQFYLPNTYNNTYFRIKNHNTGSITDWSVLSTKRITTGLSGDLDDYTDDGMYTIFSTTNLTNLPELYTKTNGILFVYNVNNNIIQIYSSKGSWFYRFYSSSWSKWHTPFSDSGAVTLDSTQTGTFWIGSSEIYSETPVNRPGILMNIGESSNYQFYMPLNNNTLLYRNLNAGSDARGNYYKWRCIANNPVPDAMFSIVDDDTVSVEKVTAFYECVNSTGCVGNYAVQTKNLSADGMVELLQTYEENGFGMCVHCDKQDDSYNESSTNYDEAYVRKDLCTAVRKMNLYFCDPYYWIAPYGVTGTINTDIALGLGFKALFSNSNTTYNVLGSTKYRLYRVNIDGYPDEDKPDIDTLKNLIDEAYEHNGWLIFTTHAANWSTMLETESYDATEQVTEILNYANEKGLLNVNIKEGFNRFEPFTIAQI